MNFPTIVLLLVAIFVADSAIAAAEEPAPLCSDMTQEDLPEDIRMDQKRVSMQSALQAISYIQDEMVTVMGNYDPKKVRNCRQPDCIAGVAWEIVNMGVPNRLLNIRGALLRLNALYLRERYQAAPDKSSQTAFDAAKKEYCDFMNKQAVID